MESRCSEIGCLIDEYDLSPGIIGGDLNEYLKARWLGKNEFEGDESISQITDWFNKLLLKTVYENNNRHVKAGRLELEYDILTGDDEFKKAQLLQSLENQGIDGEELISNIISATVMHSYLNECIEADEEK